MQIDELSLKGAKLITPKIYEDERGFFLESFQKNRYNQLGSFDEFVQDNHSFSKKGTIRGMHFQSTPGQHKLISVTSGTIFDVIVDVRKDSPTFKKWEGVILDDKTFRQLYIPLGFAHGFCVMSNDAHVVYKVSNFYSEEKEKEFRWDDPEIGIAWPIEKPLLSKRDEMAPFFEEVIKHLDPIFLEKLSEREHSRII